MLTIDGKYIVVPDEGVRPVASSSSDTLLKPIMRLLRGKSPAFTRDYFDGMRTVLIGIRVHLISMIGSSEKLLEEETARWAKTAAAAFGSDFIPQPSQQQQQQFDDGGGDEVPATPVTVERRGPGRPRKERPPPVVRSNLELWSISRAKDDKVETGQDRRIIYCIERLTSFRDTLAAVNRLLGPSVWLDASSTRRGGPIRSDALKQAFTAFVRDFPLFALGLEGWWDGTQNTGIYLLYDYDYDTMRARPLDANAISVTRDAVMRARAEWLDGLYEALEKLDNLIGLANVKNRIGSIIQTLLVNAVDARAQFFNFVITGDPGTGKTEVARMLPAIFYRLGYAPRPYPSFDQIPITTKSEWIAPYEGQSAAQARMTMLRSVGRIGVVDEAYSLVIDAADGYGKESLSQIVADLDELRGLVILVFLGYKNKTQEMFEQNAGMDRRFPYSIDIEPYSPTELYAILMNRLEATGILVPDSLRESADLMDVFAQLNRRGMFDNINAAAMSTIVGQYREVFAAERFAAAVAQGGSLRVDNIVAEERILLLAIRAFARARNLRIDEQPEEMRNKTPPLPKTVSFAPGRIRDQPLSPSQQQQQKSSLAVGGIRPIPSGFKNMRARGK